MAEYTFGRKTRYFFEYLFLRFIHFNVNLIPFSWLDRISRIIVFFIYPFAGAARRRISNNLNNTLPEFKKLNNKRFIKTNLRHTIRTSFEVVQARKFRKANFMAKYVRPVSERAKTYFDNPTQGILVLQGHLGSWEIPIPAYTHYGIPLTIVLKKQRNPFVDRMVEKSRLNYGAIITYIDETSKIIRALKNRAILGMASDQDAGDNGVFVDFLGRKCSAFTGPATMAYLTGSKLCLLTCIFQGKGVYEVDVFDIYDTVSKKAFQGKTKEEAILEVTQKWCDVLAEKVKENPEQYLWLHRRWMTRPPEEKAAMANFIFKSICCLQPPQYPIDRPDLFAQSAD